jgi:Holliday junction resolvase RusA-like endonuclease
MAQGTGAQHEPRYAPLAFYCVAYGAPAAQGSKKHVGGGRMIESSAAVAPWREAVKTAARIVIEDAVDMPFRPYDEPLSVELVFTLRKPVSAPKRRRTWPDRKPDIDKLVRSTFDALTDAGVWTDDARVVKLAASKTFPGDTVDALSSPGVVIRVWRCHIHPPEAPA